MNIVFISTYWQVTLVYGLAQLCLVEQLFLDLKQIM
jgi:hypothetical protein